jgi:light-regulated signal transduction histidine kinase (bacteriophytochrome)
MADPARLAQVFASPVSNEAPFRRPDVPLRIRVGGSTASGRSRSATTGSGSRPSTSTGLFTILRRLHTKDAYPGTGIGLAIVKRIVDRHGERVRSASMPCEGSTFSFPLPAA